MTENEIQVQVVTEDPKATFRKIVDFPPIPPIPLKLALKLALVLGEIPDVPRLGVHEQQGYRYPRASDINAAARTVLSKHHIFPLWRPLPEFEWREFQSSIKNSLMREVTMWFDLMLMDADSGESVTVQWPGVAADMMTSDKVLAKAETNALKTFLVMQFQIPDDGADTDRGAETEDTRSKKPTNRPPNWPQEVHGVVQEVQQKAEGWMVKVRGIRYWTKVKPFADQLTAARGKEVAFVAEIGKGPDNQTCPVITRILNGSAAASPPGTPAGKPSVSKEELF